LCGCQTSGPSDITGSIGSVAEKSEASRSGNPRQDLAAARERHRANPKDVDAAVQYGKALRATGQKSQAVAVLEQASIANPGNSLGGSDPRIRANLALVVGLQGRVAEAENIAKADLPPEEAAANVANLKRLLSRKEARAEGGKLPVASAKHSD